MCPARKETIRKIGKGKTTISKAATSKAAISKAAIAACAVIAGVASLPWAAAAQTSLDAIVEKDGSVVLCIARGGILLPTAARARDACALSNRLSKVRSPGAARMARSRWNQPIVPTAH